MAYEHLWQNEAWRKAFQRWWDEDWSWAGLGMKHCRASLGTLPDEHLGTLQDVWREEETQKRLIDFAGRKWTRFHLPPLDRDGNPYPSELWNKAKDKSCFFELKVRLDAAGFPNDAVLKNNGLEAVRNFAELRGVVFSDVFTYNVRKLVADLSFSIFLESIPFSKRVLARFGHTTFSRDASFNHATFSGTAWFYNATFSGDARFNDVRFSEDAWFESATFSRDARFDDTIFSRNAVFDGATFSGDAMFDGTTFSGDAMFNGTTFSGYAVFDGATFSGDAMFDGATFSRDAMFGGTTPFPKGANYRSARFRGLADFSGRVFKERTDFSGTRFYDVPKFHGAKLHPDTIFLDARFPGEDCALPPLRLNWFYPLRWINDKIRSVARAKLKRWMRWRGRIGPRWWRNRPWKVARFSGVPFAVRWDKKLEIVRRAHDSDAEACEIAYRQLRRLCAEIGSIEYEGRFHALELKAHRARTDTQIPARMASWLYEKLSDYGRSLSRPLWWLMGSWAGFTVFYRLFFMPPYDADATGLLAGTCQSMGGTRSWNEIFVTAGREFLPSLFGMANATNQPHWLRCAEAAHPVWFFLVGAVQIVVFIACVSLFLIALRRRFQLRD